jgi:hypothetical protein
MNWLGGFIRRQGQFLLDHPGYALLHILILAVLPYTAWLSVALMALITLRKGEAAGKKVLIPALLANFAISLISISPVVATINTLLTFIPCFLGACLLRSTVSWRAVTGCFFVLLVISVLIVQFMVPNFVMAQYLFIKTILTEAQTDNTLFELINTKTGLSPEFFANYLFGVQAAGVCLSALFSLMLARSVQSQLYYPGGFREEMLSFRGNKLGLLILMILLLTSWQGNVLAMNILPTLVLYFLLAGLSLTLRALGGRGSIGTLILLVVPMLFLPFILVPIYVILGTLDSLFNFRIYLRPAAGKRTEGL